MDSFYYETITEAIEQLRKRGFTIDFSLDEDGISGNDQKFPVEHFEIIDVYRYEGDSDPGDEATVYAIESRTGLKGVLVTGYGISAEDISDKMLAKLRQHK